MYVCNVCMYVCMCMCVHVCVCMHVQNLRPINEILQRLSELWTEANGFIRIISACEDDRGNADAITKRSRARRGLAQLRERAKEEVCKSTYTHARARI